MPRRRFRNILPVLVHLVFLLFLASVVVAQSTPTETPIPAPVVIPETATPNPTEAPIFTPTFQPTVEPLISESTEEPSTDPTEQPPVEITEESSIQPTAETTAEPVVEVSAEATVETTPEVLVEATAEVTETPAPEITATITLPHEREPQEENIDAVPSLPQPLIAETSCRMNVTDAGDDNAFTFTFEATNVNNMASLAWDFGDTAVTTDVASGAGPHNYTYTATGSFNITLTCTPAAGFGSPFVLTGSISISTVPVADFVLSPGVTFTTLPPVTINATNTSTGDGLSYNWSVSTSSTPGIGILASGTTNDFSFTFTDAHLNAGTYPATFYFHLSVTDGAGVVASKWQSVVFNAPPPTIDFTLDPSAGAITPTQPLEITVEGIDLGTGPITSWTWDFGDGTIINGDPSGGSITDSITHSYTAAPVAPDDHFLVTLRADGPGGFHSISRAVVIYPDTDPVQANATYQVIGPNGGGTEICFTNTSTGPYVITEWDFDNNGVFEVTDNNAVVCHTFTGTNFEIRLRVTGEDVLNTSTATVTVDTTLAPVAAFSIVPGATVEWGTTINLVDASTGDNLTYAWDFDGDGDIDSTDENPTNIPLTALGQYPIRLTVSNQYGTSYVEHILTITPLTLTCDFTGSLSVAPGSAGQTYTSTVSGNGGQPITYHWTIAGNGFTQTTQNASIDWDDIGYGSYVLTLEASSQINGAAQPATCNVSKTVIHNWQPLDCEISGPTSVFATGTGYTYTANVASMGARAGSAVYTWSVNGSPVQTGSSNTFNWTSPVATGSLPTDHTISYSVSVNNGSGYTPATSTCDESTTVRVEQWPDLICTGISAVTSGGFSPLPVTPNNTTRSYTYQANTTGIQNRNVTYSWSVVGGTITSANPSSSNQVTVRWDATSAEFPPAGANESLSVSITVVNPDPANPSDNCNQSQNISVTINHLQCNTPSGDQTPVVGETNSYSRNINNLYGRTPSLTWQLERRTSTSPDTWESVTLTAAQANADPFSWTFLDPGQTYRVRYTATVAAVSGLPADSCSGSNAWSNWLQLDVWGTSVGFQCESNLSGTTTIPNAGSYTYNLTIDNGNGYNLRYSYYIQYGSGPLQPLNSFTSTADGTITSPVFTQAQLGPQGRDNQYTLWVEVAEVNATNTDYTCSRSLGLNVGTLTASFGYTAGSWSSNMYAGNPAIPVDQEICFNNTSTMIPAAAAPPPNYTYQWTVTDASNNVVTTSTAANLPCMSFASTGNYTVSLRVYNPSGQISHSSSRVFGIYAHQGILINRTGSSFAPSTQNFSATPTGTINSYAWEFRRISDNSLVASGSGQTPSQYFSTAGMYRAIVRGTGPLGVTSASLDFELLPSSGISAGFKASQYGGVAPMNVCFTDTSISLTPITQWQWDFDGDGNVDLSYNASNIPASICYTYSTPGTVTTPRLTVTNGSNTATATRPIRTYNPVESASSFSITPNGNGSYCFTAQIPDGVTVVGWDFGDTSTGGAQEYICHSYGASGTYLVSMHINGGTVVREVEVVVTNDPPPELSITALCSDTRVATFVITNNGGDMTIADIVRVFNGTTLIATDTVLLDEDEHATFTYSNQSGTVTLTTVDNTLTGTASTNCYYPPELSVAATCSSNLPVFTVTNARYTDGPMVTSQSYEIRNSVNVIVAQGSFQLGLNQQSVELAVPAGNDPYDTYTFSSDGASGTLSQSHNCATRPVLEVSGECANPLTFTVRNTGGAMVVGQNYEITNLAGTVVITSGTLNLALNGSTIINLPTGIDPYAGYVFVTVGGFVAVTPYTLSCSRPVVEITSDCTYPIVFTVRNTGGDMLVGQDYTIVDGNNNVIESGTLPLLTTNATTTYTLTGLDPYAGYTFSSDGGFVTFSGTQNCSRPILEITSECAYPIVFRVTNLGGEMLVGEAYTITDGANNIVQSGTIPVLAYEDNATFTLTGLDPYAGYTFSNGSGFVTFSGTQNCDRPIFEITSNCADPIVFTVRNIGGDMLVEQPFAVTQDGVTVTSGNLNLTANNSTTVTLPAGIDPYLAYVFSSSGAFVTVADYTHDCENPVLVITSDCAASIVFTVENTGGDMLLDQNYEIVDASNVVITSGSFNLAKAASTTVSLPPGINPYASYTLRTTGGFVSTSYTHDCTNPEFDVVTECAAVVSFTVTNSGGEMLIGQDYTVIDLDGVSVVSGTLDLGVGEDTVIIVPDANPYQRYTLQSNGFAGSINVVHECQPPVLAITYTCIAPIHFTITNHGSEMLTPHEYTLLVRNGENVTPPDNNFMLKNGEAIDVMVPGMPFSYDLSLSTGDFGIDASGLFSCVEPTTEPPTEGESPVNEIAAQPTVTPTRTPVSVAANTTAETVDNSNFTPITAQQAVDWANVPVCGYNCPTFRMYHTDETGDWEVFRLDGANAETRESIRQNLTFGEGEGVEDLAPSLSPNTEWIVFSSNRDGNWEIYVAPTSGGSPDSIQRITYNDYAIDTDPVWGPNNYVVFETTRNGSWDLYAIDMSTGRVFPLMDEPADSREINPFWSPDGSRIVFQSNRPDEYGERKWQIYELELASGNLTRLSDGTTIDTDPQYSSDGSRVLYRRFNPYIEGSSSLWYMNADGSNPQLISEQGSALFSPSWSPNSRYIAYHSNLDGDLDVYVYEVSSGITRKLTDNDIDDYAPTWNCDEETIIFTSEIGGNADIYEAPVQPISDGPLRVEVDAEQLTFDPTNDMYPMMSPSEENSSREGRIIESQDNDRFPNMSGLIPRLDPSSEDADNDDWQEVNVCPA